MKKGMRTQTNRILREIAIEMRKQESDDAGLAKVADVVDDVAEWVEKGMPKAGPYGSGHGFGGGKGEHK